MTNLIGGFDFDEPVEPGRLDHHLECVPPEIRAIAEKRADEAARWTEDFEERESTLPTLPTGALAREIDRCRLLLPAGYYVRAERLPEGWEKKSATLRRGAGRKVSAVRGWRLMLTSEKCQSYLDDLGSFETGDAAVFLRGYAAALRVRNELED